MYYYGDSVDRVGSQKVLGDWAVLESLLLSVLICYAVSVVVTCRVPASLRDCSSIWGSGRCKRISKSYLWPSLIYRQGDRLRLMWRAEWTCKRDRITAILGIGAEGSPKNERWLLNLTACQKCPGELVLKMHIPRPTSHRFHFSRSGGRPGNMKLRRSSRILWW